MNTTPWRYVNDVKQMSINKERYWLTLTLLGLEVQSMTLQCFASRNALCHLMEEELTSWLSFVVSNYEVITFPLVSWVRCGA